MTALLPGQTQLFSSFALKLAHSQTFYYLTSFALAIYNNQFNLFSLIYVTLIVCSYAMNCKAFGQCNYILIADQVLLCYLLQST